MAPARTLLLATVLALALAAAAAADNPTVRIAEEDQARAEAALARLSDFGAGWSGGARTPEPLTGPACPGFDPKESDLVVTGHAQARFAYARGGVVVEQDTQVLESELAVKTDFTRTVQPALARCLAHEIRASANGSVRSVAVRSLPFPRVGALSAAYRAVVVVRSGRRVARIVSDFVFVGQGRLEFSLNVVAPAVEQNELVPFEQAIVEKLVSRSRTPGAVA